MLSSRKLLVAPCVIAALFSIASWTMAAGQAKPSRPELQQQFDAALKLYNEGQYEKAAAALDEILRMDPTSREALDLREKVGMGTLVKMLGDPNVGPKARILLRKADEEAQKVSRDPATTRSLIEKTTSEEIVARWAAIRQLTRIGPFAVPQLLDAALSAEQPVQGSRKVAALIALRSMGVGATPPLVVALRYGTDEEAVHIAALIAENPDARAVPALAAIAEDDARPREVREAAAEALRTILSPATPPAVAARGKEKPKGTPGVTTASTSAAARPAAPAPAPLADAAQAYYRMAERYYYADPTLLEVTPEPDRVLWRWNPQGKTFAEHLVFEKVPMTTCARAMAADAILAGMQRKHATLDLLALYVCNSYMALEEAEGIKRDVAESQAVRAVNESLGAEYLYMALGRALKDGSTSLARRCIAALASVGDPRPPKDNTLVAALSFPDKFVRVEAALALVHLSPMGNLGGTGEAVQVMAAGLGAPAQPRAAILTADGALYQRLAKAIQESGMAAERQKNAEEAMQRTREAVPPLNVLVVDWRVEGEKTTALLNSLRRQPRSAKLPIVLLASPEQVEKLRARGDIRPAAVLSLTADAAAVRTAVANAASSSSSAPGGEVVRENLELLRRILQSLAELPPATKYPAQDLGGVAAGFLKNQPNEIRVLAVRVIGSLPQPGLRDMVFDIYASSRETAEIRHEAGASLLKLLVVNPRMDPQQQAALRLLASDADEALRMCAIHALATASIPQAEREARVIEVGAPLLVAPPTPKQ